MSEPLASEPMVTDNDASNEAQIGDIEATVEMGILPSTTVEAQAEDAQTSSVQFEAREQSHAPMDIEPAPIENSQDAHSPAPAPASEERPYIPQFSPTTSHFIMSRLNGATRTSPPPNIVTAPAPTTPTISQKDIEDTPVDYSHLPLTLHLPNAEPVEPSAAPPSHLPSSGAKRKRTAAEDEASQKSANFPPYPEPAILRRPIPRPPVKRKRTKDDGSGNPMCVKCNRISATDGNLIVPCSCGEAWHQLCHDPEISEDVVVGGSPLKFKCVTCKEEEKQQAKYHREIARYREAKQEQSEWKKYHNDVERRREKRLATLPEFPKPSLVGFEGGSASGNERREYFSDLKRSDLINLLLFSEQIQPGLLVDVLASVSKKHPDLPIFGSPDWAEPKVQYQEPQPRRQQDHRAAPKPSKQRSKTGGVRKILKTAPAGAADQAAADAEDSEDALPESWPKAGHGLYQRLKPERDDPLLYDENDEEAFSHFMVDKHGKQIMEPLASRFLSKKMAGSLDGPGAAASDREEAAGHSVVATAVAEPTVGPAAPPINVDTNEAPKSGRRTKRSQKAAIDPDTDAYTLFKELAQLKPWF
ncbi:hypothetical protein CORC01_12310 [Colletotrichum orchidophilum]|uniref:Zinc finger PHD-type domain-containing protein n=1 Tax=Colletotrichum orchidophilum TaxID=1209926 RepID=A0A1G4ATG3_9PEZI|nr:uncharacterized protein CORC01_12310 [Colletotrichum orchidophilum]OHE92383.1 hypothetical protein CORC01_12310 [Colletotrichum orchidophilum]